jgi:phosphoketolase
MIVLRSPKGWTGPKELERQETGELLAVPPGAPAGAEQGSRAADHARGLDAQLPPEELFDAGAPWPELQALSPTGRAAWAPAPMPMAACCAEAAAGADRGPCRSCGAARPE